jgi:cellulase (glycosyl hydrolase family 5)
VIRPLRIAHLLTAVTAAACLAAAAPAHASHDAEVSIMDDQLLLGRSQAFIDSQMSTFQALGVDRVRVSAFWDGNSPASGSRRRPAGFDPANPNDSGYQWAALDRVVFSAVAHGLKVMLSVTTPGPVWAVTRTRNRNRVWRPNASLFGQYAEAVARRYGAVVDHYGISNEPNQGGWLQPQSGRGGLISPHLYRAMVQAAYPRIKAADPTSVALIGNLASSGSRARGRRAPIRPLAFLRAMACVDSHYRPVNRGSCRHFRPVPADAVGHHPYEFFSPPSRPTKDRDDAGIGDSRRLLQALDRLVRRGRIKPSRGRRLGVYYTEFGYQTNPPDPFAGISLRRQSRYLQQAAYLVWRIPRIHALNQFRLTDGALRGRGLAAFREFQSGLLFSSRRAKPSFRSFRNPFVISGGRYWGQVRPGGAHGVEIQRAAHRRGPFRTVRRVRTDTRGYFSVNLGRHGGFWRFRYSDGPSGTSDVLHPG